MRNKKTTLFIFNPCLNKQIIYCLSKIQITRHKVLPYLVLKISQNMPAKKNKPFVADIEKRHGLQWEVYFHVN